MELKVYNGELFERGKLWYVIFLAIILVIVIGSILFENVLGGVLVLLFTGGYLFSLTKVDDVISMKIGQNSLQIGKMAYAWNTLSGFVLEYHTEKNIIHNIVLIDSNQGYKIYTIADSQENLENFVNNLSDYIPMLENYTQSTFDRFIRKIKL